MSAYMTSSQGSSTSNQPPSSSQPQSLLIERPWKVQDPHPLDGEIKCLCERGKFNIAKLLISRTDANPGRQFFTCPNTDAKCSFWKWADQISGPGVPSSSPRGPKRPSAQPGTQKATQPQVRAPPPSSSKLNSIQQNPSAAHSGISDSPARLGIKTEPSVPQTPSRLIRIAPRTPLTNEQKAERLAKLNAAMVQQEPSTPAARTSSERKGENLDPVSPTDPSPFPSSTSATQDTSSFPSLSVRGLAVLDGDVENGYASDDELLYALPKWPMLSASLQTTGENGADEQARRHSRSLESKGKGKQRSNGLPTPKKTPEEEAGWNDDEDHDARTDSNPSSGGKRKREEMEDAGHNPFLQVSPPFSYVSSRISTHGPTVGGLSRITLLEQRISEQSATTDELHEIVARQAVLIKEQGKTIEYLRDTAAGLMKDVGMLKKDANRMVRH